MALTYQQVVAFLTKRSTASEDRIRKFAELYSAGERNGRKMAKDITRISYRTCYHWLRELEKAEAAATGTPIAQIRQQDTDSRLTRHEALEKLDQAIRDTDDPRVLERLLERRAALTPDWRRNEEESDEINPFHVFGKDGTLDVEQALIDRFALLCYNRASLPSFWKSVEIAANDPEAFLRTRDPDRVILSRLSTSNKDDQAEHAVPGPASDPPGGGLPADDPGRSPVQSQADHPVDP